jgi:hypothetical protein
MALRTCARCEEDFEEIIRGYCRKCYYALKWKGQLSNVEKPIIKSLNKIQKDLLIGSLLGDAWLGRNATSKHAHLKIERSYEDIEYLEYEFDILRPLCKSGVKDYPRKDGGRACYFISRSYEILDTYHQKWYEDRIKVVPPDLKLNPLIIAIWLADDGHICMHHPKYSLLRTNFATNGFSLNEVEFLADLLTKRYKENFNPNKTNIPKQYVITAADAATRAMWQDIKEVFPKSMSRKYIHLPLNGN